MKLHATRIWHFAVGLMPLVAMVLSLAATRRWG